MEKNMINTPEGMEILDTSVPGIEKVLTEDIISKIVNQVEEKVKEIKKKN